MRILAAILLTLLLAGCAGFGQPGDNISTNVNGSIRYQHDDINKVGCWFFTATSGAGSISCLPDSQYKK